MKYCKYWKKANIPLASISSTRNYFSGATKQTLVEKIETFLEQSYKICINSNWIFLEKSAGKQVFTFTFKVFDPERRSNNRLYSIELQVTGQNTDDAQTCGFFRVVTDLCPDLSEIIAGVFGQEGSQKITPLKTSPKITQN